MTKERNHGLDLLRLVLMFMVCMLHVLGQGGVLAACSGDAAKFGFFGLLETCSFCAVNSFALISGYAASDRPRKWSKIAEMWFQTVFYSLVLTLILSLALFRSVPEPLTLVRGLFPVTYNYYWYFTAYFALFFAAPLLNRLLASLDPEKARMAFVLMFVLFSLPALVADPFRTEYGYSAIWLMVLYCLGGLAKKIDLFAARKSRTLIALFAASTLFSWGAAVFLSDTRWLTYISPTVLLNSLLLVILFSRLRIRGTLTGKLAPLSFGVYLFQLNKIIWDELLTNRMAFAAEKPFFISVGITVACAAALFCTGLFVEFLRSRLAVLLRIPALSRKITDAAEAVLRRSVRLLK